MDRRNRIFQLNRFIGLLLFFLLLLFVARQFGWWPR
jgi:hypothetical protein